jgi:hypothetical protein
MVRHLDDSCRKTSRNRRCAVLETRKDSRPTLYRYTNSAACGGGVALGLFLLVGPTALRGLANDSARPTADAGMFASCREIAEPALCILLTAGYGVCRNLAAANCTRATFHGRFARCGLLALFLCHESATG